MAASLNSLALFAVAALVTLARFVAVKRFVPVVGAGVDTVPTAVGAAQPMTNNAVDALGVTITMPLPQNAGCNVESSPLGPMNRGIRRPPTDCAHSAMFPAEGALGGEIAAKVNPAPNKPVNSRAGRLFQAVTPFPIL